MITIKDYIIRLNSIEYTIPKYTKVKEDYLSYYNGYNAYIILNRKKLNKRLKCYLRHNVIMLPKDIILNNKFKEIIILTHNNIEA